MPQRRFRATKRNYILSHNEECCSNRFDHLVSDPVESGETVFMENRRSWCNSNTEGEWLSVRVHRRFIYILYIYIYRGNSSSKSSNRNSGCSLREVGLDADIFWHFGLQSVETLLLPFKIMFTNGRFKIHQYRSLLSRSSALCFSLAIAYSISGQCKEKMCSLDMNLIESDMAGY